MQLFAIATAEGAVLVILTLATATEAATLAVRFEPEPGG
jgi:hypothetical protein